MNNSERFDSALYGVPNRISEILMSLPKAVKENAQEIRLRANLPVALTVRGDTAFVNSSGNVSFGSSNELVTANSQELNECFRLICRNSAYAHTDELSEGYINMSHGHRAGVCGTLGKNGIMKNISSVNIRIAREIRGAANDIIGRYERGGLLIAGPPGSGKTTILRDLVRQLSNGISGKSYRIAVIDSRGEISGGGETDLGRNTDVLVTKDKAQGIEIAVRTLYPEIVAFDEIGSADELAKVSESFLAGVSIITTAHIGSASELNRRRVTRELLSSDAIGSIALLPEMIGGKIGFLPAKAV